MLGQTDISKADTLSLSARVVGHVSAPLRAMRRTVHFSVLLFSCCVDRGISQFKALTYPNPDSGLTCKPIPSDASN